ncbi:MAG: hypothetical protein BroJett011_44030 [Chloroflexota bacterium]|nr:MAG: hypothetical protein BroJett011_44030 [Chloroflexota bacterium]
MPTVTISQINESLQKLPADKLVIVYDFVSYLIERDVKLTLRESSEAYETMIASEAVLRRDWDRPEEDEAWADL